MRLLPRMLGVEAQIGIRMKDARFVEPAICDRHVSWPGAALDRTGSGVPSNLGGTAPRRRGAEIPTQHRRRIGPRSLHRSPDVVANAGPRGQRRNAGKRSQATVMPPNLAEFLVPSSTIALLPILPPSTTCR